MARDPRSFLEKVKGVLSAIDEAQTALAADSPQTLPLGLTSAYDALRPVQAMCFGVKQYIESVIGGKPSRKPSFSHLRRDVEILARWEEKVLPVCVEPSQKLFAAYYETVVRKAQDLFDPLTDMMPTQHTTRSADGSRVPPPKKTHPAGTASDPILLEETSAASENREAPVHGDNESGISAGLSIKTAAAAAPETQPSTVVLQDEVAISHERGAATKASAVRSLTEEEYKLCQQILKDIKRFPEAIYFRAPVRDGSPNELDNFEPPLDISTIQYKLETGTYKSPGEMHEDVERMLDNLHRFGYEAEQGRA